MSSQPPDYHALCRSIWDFYDGHAAEFESRLGLRLAKPMLPPPLRGKPVAMMFVGLSPSLTARTRGWFAETFEEAQEHARLRRYVGPKTEGHTYSTYYGPLLKIAKLTDVRLGLWHQDADWLVEFTDLCHLPVKPNNKLLELFRHRPDVREHCKTTLTKELLLYQPRVVVSNGCETSECIWELWGEGGAFDPSRHSPIIERPDLGCVFHLTGFITPPRTLDVYGQVRLARELRDSLNRPQVANN